MRIGVICEGPTDFVVMRSFFTSDLAGDIHGLEFDLIQPALDNTLPGGWSQVLYWLENNPPENRNSLYRKGQSLFLEESEDEKFDALIFQIDTDIIGEPGFERYCEDRGVIALRPQLPTERANFVRHVLINMSANTSLDQALNSGEIPIAIVEACETWVVAAGVDGCDAESMSPNETCDNFGRVLAKHSGQPERESYRKINKNVQSRQRLCSQLCRHCTPRGRATHYDISLSHIRRATIGN